MTFSIGDAGHTVEHNRLAQFTVASSFGNDSTDSYTHIQAKIDAVAAAGGGEVLLPEGIFVVSQALVLPSRVALRGAGFAVTEIKLAAGANDDVIRTVGFSSLTNTDAWFSSENVPYGFAIRDLQVNGNKANNTSGGGIRIYGKGYTVHGVLVRDASGAGYYSECGAKTGQSDWTDLPETYIGDVRCRNNDGIGFHFRGPHNAQVGNISSAFNGDWGASFEVSANYDGNCDQVAVLHTYANGGDKGTYVGTVVHFDRLIGDGDNIQIDATKCTISQLKILNAGSRRDALHLTANADLTQIDQIDITMRPPVDAASRTAMLVECARSQFGQVRLSGNSHTNDGLVLSGTSNQVASVLAIEFNAASMAGVRVSGTRQRVTSGFITNCTTAVAYTPGSKNTIQVDAFVTAAQVGLTGTPAATDNITVRT